MLEQKRRTHPLRTVLLSAAGAVALLVAGPALGASAAWDASAPIGTASISTGSLGIDPAAVPTGTWTKDGTGFDPSSDKLTAGTTLVYTAKVPVTAVGNNLKATFSLGATTLPDHISAGLSSSPAVVLGRDSSTDGKQVTTLALTLTADSGLPTGDQTVDLRNLIVTLSNGHGWKDTATLDAGTLTAGADQPAGGTLRLEYQTGRSSDHLIALYLTDPEATIDWGDGTEQAATSTGRYTHTYTGQWTSSTLQVAVTGTLRGLGSADQTVADIEELVGLRGWDEGMGTISTAHAFQNAINLDGMISTLPATIKDMSFMFAGAANFNQSVSGWDTSHVTTMAHMFDGATSFNSWVGSWNTSRVTDMSFMFRGAKAFNQALAQLDVSNVVSVSHMFDGATSFNQSLTTWDVSNVESMDYMFAGATQMATSVNSNWGAETSKVTTMAHMFDGATSFKSTINAWDTSSVTDMSFMFDGATAFNSTLDNWVTANVVTMEGMFRNATTFNKTITKWETGKVTLMTNMFNGAMAFNQPLAWDTAAVTNMDYMFFNAAAMSQDLSTWNVAKVSSHSAFAAGSQITQLPPFGGTKGATKPSASPTTPTAEPTTTPSPSAPAPSPSPTDPTPEATPTATPEPATPSDDATTEPAATPTPEPTVSATTPAREEGTE